MPNSPDPRLNRQARPDTFAAGYEAAMRHCAAAALATAPDRTVSLDTLDRWQERTQEMNLDIVRLGDRPYTKAEAVALLDDLHLRLNRLSGDLWGTGHTFVEGKGWTPPTRYMREMAATAPAAGRGAGRTAGPRPTDDREGPAGPATDRDGPDAPP